jgi:thioredoxin-related protein
MNLIKYLVVLMFVLPVELFAQVKWLTIQQALELSQKEPKKIFIDVYTDWCGWCKRMDAVTFNHPVIAEKLNKDFYPVKFNAESKEPVVFAGTTFINEGRSHQFAIALLQGQLSFPSVAFLDEKLVLLVVQPGFKTASQFEPILDFLGQDIYKSQSYDQFIASFKGKVE